MVTIYNCHESIEKSEAIEKKFTITNKTIFGAAEKYEALRNLFFFHSRGIVFINAITSMFVYNWLI